MISFDFEYYRPTSSDEAVNLFMDLDSQGKAPIYYAGGTEIISQTRMNKLNTGAVIDIKEIPECNILGTDDNSILIGAAVTLTKISEKNLFPLLTKVIRRSSDHTSRNKITIGGNICGKIPYRETTLPFLLCDSMVMTKGPKGNKSISICQLFNEKLRLERGELLLQIATDKNYTKFPFQHIKKTKQGSVDYPLVSAAFLKNNNIIRAAFSGICAFPFRMPEIEGYISDTNISIEDKVAKIISSIQAPILNDIIGSAEYRQFIFKNVLTDGLEKIGGIK